ncbi:EexN family lipoprotein [Rahnella perminowiae]|uniref:EexN family lipoprotein n=1 Tax=Rahnella perminowiae TaxID=2816244 RepID=UPI00215C6085|nr:EexN family lipoprotein [Rahnella perminowiae]MCR8998674.1 EexN family lipoprotein [Rahnella perminowiae]MCR8998732.1 EexN family lipoprotein [Rahnella perminowiae]
MKKLLLVIVATLAISGCGEKIYDSSYFQANPDKAEEALKKCDSGDMSGGNCENARKGLDDYKAQKLKAHLEGKDK